MTRLPERPDIDHLKKQAKNLLAALRRGEPGAVARLRASLPGAGSMSDAELALLRLHDTQSCIAREHGFPSWSEIAGFVAARRAATADRSALVAEWLRLVYPGDIAGGTSRASPMAAARILAARPDIVADDPWLACAVGDVAAIRAAAERDAGWINQAGGPLVLPPLVALTQSGLVRHPDYRDRMLVAARLLIDAGADPDQSVPSRWPPASLAEPAAEHRLSALYGAAGQNRDPDLTRILLAAGANPDDNESLYHSLENPQVTRILLEAGARIDGTNAQFRVFDLDSLEALHVLIAFGRREAPPIDWSRPLLFAIRRGRSPAHVEALLDAGADPAVRAQDGTSAHGLALRYGLTDVADMLRRAAGVAGPLSDEERFVAACAAADELEARRIQSARPDWPASLPETRLRMLPELAANGRDHAVRLMVELGWPIETRGGDWGASALNLAVFRGDAAMARFLLERGADWRSQHDMGDNVCGTLSWASVNEPEPDGDWLGCAEALVAHGMPRGEPAAGDFVSVGGKPRRFSDEVAAFLLGRAHVSPFTPSSSSPGRG